MAIIVRCPRCGASASIEKSNEFRPFCSARCRDVDLHAWATSQYHIAGDSLADEMAESLAEDHPFNPGSSTPN